MMDRIADSPTPLIAPRPNRIRRSSTTVNLYRDSETLGGRTSRPIDRAVVMYCTTLSVLSMIELRSAAMNSAG